MIGVQWDINHIGVISTTIAKMKEKAESERQKENHVERWNKREKMVIMYMHKKAPM